MERLLWAVVVAIAHILITKPAIDTGNLAIQIPMMRFLDGSASFGSDPIVYSFKNFTSYFFSLFALLRIPDSVIRILFGTLYFFFDSLIFYLLLSIWDLLGFKKKIYWLSAVVIASGYLPVLSSANWSYVFSHQMVGIVFALLSILCLLEGKILLSFVLTGIGLNFHAIFLAPAILYATFYLIKRRKYFDLIAGYFFCVLFSLPVLALAYRSRLVVSDVRLWSQIASFRSPSEVFPFRRFSDWIPFLSFSAIFAGYSRINWHKIKEWASPLILTVLVFIFLQFLFTEIWLVPAIARMQFLRCSLYFVLLTMPSVMEYVLGVVDSRPSKIPFLMPAFGAQPESLHIVLWGILTKKIPFRVEYFMGFIFLASYFIVPLVSDSSFWENFFYFDVKLYLRNGLIMLSALGLLFFSVKRGKRGTIHKYLLISALIVGVARSFLGGVFLTQSKQWVDVQRWAFSNSGEDDIFLIPPERGDFRVYSRRGVVFDWKGGSFALYFSWDYAKVWWRRLQDFHTVEYTRDGLAVAYRKMSQDEKIALAKKYNAKYIVVSNSNNFTGKPVYSNDRWSIYKSR